MTIYQDWLTAKENERTAIEARRLIEDELVQSFHIAPDLDGTERRQVDGYEVKIVGRLNRRIDSDLLQELAAENGLTDHLPHLFRWKPEINARAWSAAADSITAPLLKAITVTPGRPSFSITALEQ